MSTTRYVPRPRRVTVRLLSTLTLLLATACSAPADGEEAPEHEADAASEALVVHFSGQDGPDGCRYDGPTEIGRGASQLRLENTSDKEVRVILSRFTEGHGYDDLLASFGDELPNEPDVGDIEAYAWAAGVWRELIRAEGGETQEGEATFMPGEAGLMCWAPGTPPKVGWTWPATPITVTD